MPRISKMIERIENKISVKYEKHKSRLGKYIVIGIIGLYFYGIVINAVDAGIRNTFGDGRRLVIEWSPFKNIFAIFSSTGFGLTFIILLMFALLTKRGQSLISGYKTIKDKARNIEILPEGTHGSSRWLTKPENSPMFDVGTIEKLKTPVMGRLPDGDFIGINDVRGFNKNIMVFGAPGTGKSQGFVKPFIMQSVVRSAVGRGESCILVDPKAEFYEAFSEYFREQGYVVRAFNLLDMENSDAWNCLNDTAMDRNLVQAVAEVIIRNTSNADERQDFWEKSEKNLLMALMLYVQSLTYPNTDELLPIEERSLGAIYRLMSTTSFTSLDAKFKNLPIGHPAINPYGIFKQAARQLWGNIAIGLGSRLNVFQNELVDKITKYNQIDLELPGKQKCAYFCIISDQETSSEFLSSMFFSLLFMKLSDYARKHGENRRLPVEVNVILDEFCNIGKVLDFKKTISTVRSRGINCQVIVQSVAQLADRYPKTEWEEIVGNCDTQLFLGCNDIMTAEFMSKQCGDMTVRVNNANIPMTPLFSPVINSTRPYVHGKTSTGRPLMMPDEVRRLPQDEAILLVRWELPLKLKKILPDEHPDYPKLKTVKVSDYKPEWISKDLQNQNATPLKSNAPAQKTDQLSIWNDVFNVEDEETILNPSDIKLEPVRSSKRPPEKTTPENI